MTMNLRIQSFPIYTQSIHTYLNQEKIILKILIYRQSFLHIILIVNNNNINNNNNTVLKHVRPTQVTRLTHTIKKNSNS